MVERESAGRKGAEATEEGSNWSARRRFWASSRAPANPGSPSSAAPAADEVTAGAPVDTSQISAASVMPAHRQADPRRAKPPR